MVCTPTFKTVSFQVEYGLFLTCLPANIEICPGLNANEIQIPYDKHHKVSTLVKCHQNTHNSVKYELI